jgi:hypothetical protein
MLPASPTNSSLYSSHSGSAPVADRLQLIGNHVLQLVCAHRNVPSVFRNALRTNSGAEAFNFDVMRLSNWVD